MFNVMKKQLFAMLSAAAVLFAASCTTDVTDTPQTGFGDEVTVTFTVGTEALASSRSVDYTKPNPVISDGTKAHLLIYAVYDKNGVLLSQYGNGIEDEDGTLEALGYTAEENVGEGQTVRYVKEFPTTVSLRLVRGQEYKVSFWAQDEHCRAYQTNDLHKVEVRYGEAFAVNNDESRDAFCKTETFTAVENGTRTVILRRPLAQINVGVTGYDYEAASKGGCRVVESKIRINRVARYLDVVTNIVDTSEESLQAIEYDYATIPAYINMKDESGKQLIPEEKYDIEAEGTWPNGYYNGESAIYQYDGRGYYDDEALLVVNRDDDDTIAGFKTEVDEIEEGSSPYTETFKYLSMCYILVPDRVDGASTYSTTLDDVYIYLKYHDENMTPKEVHLTQVPAQRNWRTNIIGELLTANIEFEVDIDPIYAGDYNQNGDEWDGAIAEGVSYDPVADEILISNGMGLQWLADMVNAKYTESSYSPKVAELVKRATKVSEWPSANRFHFTGVTVRLLNDVDFDVADNVSDLRRKWTPIGEGDWFNYMGQFNYNNQSVQCFDGIFDGGNHTISNVITEEVAANSANSVGFFATIGWNAVVKDVRFIHMDVRGHYRTGAVVGLAYGSSSSIINCYVDDAYVESTPRAGGDAYWENGNNAGGIVGQFYADGSVENCFVRNSTIRGYRTVGGIIGSSYYSSDFYGDVPKCVNNKVTDVQVIVNQFQPYYSADENGQFYWGSIKDPEGDAIVGDEGNQLGTSGNVATNVNVIVFNVNSNTETSDVWGNPKYDNRYRYSEIANVPLEVFPRLADEYVDYIHFTSSIVGAPSGYRIYNPDTLLYDETSGSVGLYVDDLVVDGDAVDNSDVANNDYVVTVVYTDPVTKMPVNPTEDDCAIYVTGQKASTLMNITFRGDPYAYTGVYLAPTGASDVKLENVRIYDAVNAIDDNGAIAGATLTVSGSDLRGNVKYGAGYASVTFTDTVFETGTGTETFSDGKCQPGSNTKFKGCIFRPGFTFDNSNNVSLNFDSCYYGSDTDLDPLVELTADNIAEKLGLDSATFDKE